MKSIKPYQSLHITILLGMSLLVGSLACLPVYAKEPLVSSAVYKAVQNAEKQLENSAYAKALQPLKALIAESKSGSYDQAVVWKTIGAIYTAQGNYQAAADALEKSLVGDALPEQQRLDVQFNLGQVYLALNQYQQALAVLKPWIEQNQSPSAHDNLLLAQLYSELKQYDQALIYAKRLLKNKNPPENHYQMVIAINFELKKYADAGRLLETLVQRFPDNKTYWQQLAASYQYSGNYHKTTAVKDLAYRAKLLNRPDDILQLAQLYNYTGSPYLAAQLLEKEMKGGALPKSSKNLTQLSDTWFQAREYQKAATALSKAAKKLNSGEIYLRLGGLYFEQQDWQNAYTSLKTAVSKSGLKKPGNAWLLYGMSAHEINLDDEAKQAFTKAMDYTYSRSGAQQWLNSMEENSDF
ncbi:MAG: tetratricopeptide repeat protein [Methylococcales bacterium]